MFVRSRFCQHARLWLRESPDSTGDRNSALPCRAGDVLQEPRRPFPRSEAAHPNVDVRPPKGEDQRSSSLCAERDLSRLAARLHESLSAHQCLFDETPGTKSGRTMGCVVCIRWDYLDRDTPWSRSLGCPPFFARRLPRIVTRLSGNKNTHTPANKTINFLKKKAAHRLSSVSGPASMKPFGHQGQVFENTCFSGLKRAFQSTCTERLCQEHGQTSRLIRFPLPHARTHTSQPQSRFQLAKTLCLG